MQYINEKWLRLFNYYYFIVLSAMSGLYIYFAIQQQTFLVTGVDKFGISIATGILAFTGVVYSLVFLRYIKKNNLWLAYLIGFAFFGISCGVATEVSIHYTSSYIFLIHNIIVALAATTFGPTISLIALGLISALFFSTIAGGTNASPLGLVVDTAIVVAKIVGVLLLLYLLKDKYTTSRPEKEEYVSRFLVNNEVVKILTDSLGDGVIIIDTEGNVKSANPGALKLIGGELKDVLNLDYKSVLKFKTLNHEFIKPEENPITLALKSQTHTSQELIIEVKDNQELYIDLNISIISNPNSKEQYGGVIILRDVSKKKQEEAARSEFISTASHEMRTPVAAIEGYLGLALNDKVSTIDSRAREYLKKAHSSTEHLGRLFQDLLLSAKAEDGRLISHPRVVEMGQNLDQLVESFRFAAEKKGLLMDFIISASPGGQADTMKGKVIKPLYYTYIDPDRFREAITNIFDNAIKYTETGKVSIGLTGNDEIIQIFVRDTGPGIPATDIGHLFQKFYRVDNTATRTIGGTGLGLFICRKIIELYKGRIWAESRLGKGSTFFIEFPRLNNQRAMELQKIEASHEINASPLDNSQPVVQ